MLPLKDYNPTTRRAWITLGLIAVNVFVYFLIQPHGQGNVDPQSEAIAEAKFTYEHAAIACEVTHGRPLTVAEINLTLNGDTTACKARFMMVSPATGDHRTSRRGRQPGRAQL